MKAFGDNCELVIWKCTTLMLLVFKAFAIMARLQLNCFVDGVRLIEDVVKVGLHCIIVIFPPNTTS